MKGEEIPYKMLSLDAYSQWLGIEILECEIGRCKLGLTIRKDMINSMGKAHGAVSYLQQISMVNMRFQLKQVLIILRHYMKVII